MGLDVTENEVVLIKEHAGSQVLIERDDHDLCWRSLMPAKRGDAPGNSLSLLQDREKKGTHRKTS